MCLEVGLLLSQDGANMHLQALISDAFAFVFVLWDDLELAFEDLWMPRIIQNKYIFLSKRLIGDKIPIVTLLHVQLLVCFEGVNVPSRGNADHDRLLRQQLVSDWTMQQAIRVSVELQLHRLLLLHDLT